MKNIPIFFSTNDNYIPYVSTMMQSIMENTQNTLKYDFYILHKGLNPELTEKLQKQVNKYPDFSLNFIDVSEYIKGYNFFVSWHITIEAYFRLFIPYIFQNIDKAIYLDCDMVCLTDISQLFNIDISNYMIAGTSDAGLLLNYMPKNKVGKKNKKRFEMLLSMDKPQNYINSGMLLINCKKFREKYTMQYVVDMLTSKEWSFHDQDVINVLAKDSTLRIHKKWNYLPDMLSKSVNSIYNNDLSRWNYIPALYSKYAPQEILSEYLEAQNNPNIVHFKPYSVWHYIQYFEEFWKYATRTPFCREIVSQMDKNGILGKGLEEKIYTTIRTRTGFGGTAIIKSILEFFRRGFL